jgi:hypothetical protein
VRAETRSLEHISLTWKQKRAPLPDATSTDMSIEAAGDALAVAEHHLREQFDEHELRRAVESAQERVSRVAGRWHSRPVEVRDHAEKLAERPTAEEERLRAESLAQAQSDLGAAQNARGAASTEHDVARQELKAATPGDRARHTEHVDTPAHREDALRLAAEATEEASLVQTTVGTLEKERADAEQNARTAKSRSAMLRDQAERLRGVEPRPAGSAVLPREDDEIRVVIGQVATDLDAAESSCNSAMSARSQRADSLRTWAAQDRFGAVADDENGHAVRRLRELFRTEHLADRVATRAAEYVDDLAVREQRIGQQLVQVETHKNNVVHRLVDLVDESLSLLGRASRLSELPEGIGPWAGSRFLNVVERKRPTHDQVTLRVGELVDRMVQGKKIELDAVELLWRAVEASVIEGFRATVLKPAPDQPTGRTPVEEMRKWSGGENLTASLVLFCVMAKLRAEQHLGTRSGAVGGVVPLDNPLGKANYLPFLELQRKVAAASGVQLVFWTGLGDIGAVTAFPRIVAMHKGRPRPVQDAPTFAPTRTTRSRRGRSSTRSGRCEMSREPALAQAITEAVSGFRLQRVPLDAVLTAAAAVDHTAAVTVHWRQRVLVAITELVDAGVVEVPRTKLDRSSHPPLPAYLVRPAAQRPAQAEPTRTVWHADLAWVSVADDAGKLTGAERQFLQKINEWLPRRTGVSVLLRERSVDIFDDDKLLESWLLTRIFSPSRLTLELLDCEACWPPVEQQVFGQGTWLVVENFTTYTSLCRAACRFDGRIIWGAGMQVATRLTALAAAGERPPECCYFGDIDAGGFRAARTAADRAERLGFPALKPARGLYAEAIRHRRQRGRSRLGAEASAWVRQWLGGVLGVSAAEIAGAGGRIVQERVNREVLQDFGVDRWW